MMLHKDEIKTLGKRFGLGKVAEEAAVQHKTEVVRILAGQLSFGCGKKLYRIRAASIIYGWGLKRAKDWVEARFADNGEGNPI